MIVSEAIYRFLHLYTHRDLASLYSSAMEVQLVVSPEGGESSEDGRSWTNGVETWFPIRMPKNAKTVPEYNDFELKWDICSHTLGIGMTGWNFRDRLSMHVGFDFDKLTETAHRGSGLSPEELDRVKFAAMAIPWVETRRSTGGGGLHLRVFLGDGVPTANHTEHAALARSILVRMSQEAGFDFDASVDVCGGNMWIYHKKMTPENEGLTLIKPRECDYTELAPNWRDHLEVISRKRSRVRVGGLDERSQSMVDELVEGHPRTPLDDNHNKLLDWLAHQGYSCIWEQEYNMLRCHTASLASAHEALGLRGVFRTLAAGREKGDINCFAFPRDGGSWRVVRYGQGCFEAATWTNSEDSWTWCNFNEVPELKTAAAAFNAVEDPKGGYVFANANDAIDAAKAVGAILELPDEVANRQIKLKSRSDGRLDVVVPKEKGEGSLRGLITGKGNYTKVVDAARPAASTDEFEFDAKIRHILNDQSGESWVININDEWFYEDPGAVTNVLMSKGLPNGEARAVMGRAIDFGWKRVNVPFGPEYPGGRMWNKDAAKFRFAPMLEDNGVHPHWDMVLKHCGRSLFEDIQNHPWCKKNGVSNGADYLRLWVASLFQFPFARLPYLFFFSEPNQNCGKSTFHQALGLLMTKGIVRADNALTSQGNFNGEFSSSIVCVIEEVDLSEQAARVYNRLKDLVTSDEISVHVKGKTPYMQPNATHFIQCANNRKSCAVFDGDTRITSIQVYPFSNNQEIPWPELKRKLEEEAPAFLRTVLDIQIPPSEGRLRIPYIDTEDKRAAIEMSKNDLQTFIDKNCFFVPGCKVELKDFCDRFTATLEAPLRPKWTQNEIISHIPHKFPKGQCSTGVECIGNMTFDPNAVSPTNGCILVRSYSKLVAVQE
jgi:hypothetical protein